MFFNDFSSFILLIIVTVLFISDILPIVFDVHLFDSLVELVICFKSRDKFGRQFEEACILFIRLISNVSSNYC